MKVIESIWAKIQLAITVLGGALGYFLGGLDGLLIALIVFVVLDYITGVMVAIIDKTLSSEVGFKGIFRKIIIFCLVGVAHIVDANIIGTGSGLRTAIIFFYLSKRYPHQLSGGQQQRVAFARAIVIKPSIILFDEPLSALDALLRDQMRFEISALARQLGLTSIFVTHDQVEAMSMSDQVVVMDKGDILQKDSPENIYNHPATPFVARFIGKSNWLDENTMVRPEYVRLELFAGAMERDARVLGVQFLGNSYEILLQSGDMQWHLPSSRAYAVGEEMKVYIDPLKILTYQQKEETT